MDDDDMRRGNPPCHVASAGESLAAKKLEQHTLQSMAAPFLAKLCPSIPVPNSFERKIALAFHIADDILAHTGTEEFAPTPTRRNP
jgi:geranylgeranyl pyrophosphate synthase